MCTSSCSPKGRAIMYELTACKQVGLCKITIELETEKDRKIMALVHYVLTMLWCKTGQAWASTYTNKKAQLTQRERATAVQVHI